MEPIQELWSARNPKSTLLAQRARELSPGGVHHNLRGTPPLPIFYERAEGAYKWDVDGHKYVDYSLGQGSLLLGHAHPKVVEAVLGTYMPGVPAANHPSEVTWAELVHELMPSAEKVRFAMSGTEATMLAIRLARAYTGRTTIIRFAGHYNGWHDYGMVGYRPPFDRLASAGVPDFVPLTVKVVPPDDGGKCLEEMLGTEEVAGVILEPSGASWGAAPLPPGLLGTVRDLAHQHGALLIYDEVITGFRFSPGGAQARDGIIPDLTTLGKIISGGFPGAAVAGKAEVLDLMIPLQGTEPPRPYVLHHGTFNGHPVCAAAGIATLTEIRSGSPNAVADAHAALVREGVQNLIDELSICGFTYGESSIFHVFLESPAEDGRRREPSLTAASATVYDFLGMPRSMIARLSYELRTAGVDLFSYNGGMASAAHGDQELDQTLTAFEGALRAMRDDGMVATC